MQGARLLGLLLRLRKGRHTAADMVRLATRRTAVPLPDVIYLFCHKTDADAKKEEQFLGLVGESVMLTAGEKARAKFLSPAQATTLLNSAFKHLLALNMRVGAAVAMPTNLLARQGVPCGSRGVVTCVSAVRNRRYPQVRFQQPSDDIPSLVHTVAIDGENRAATRSRKIPVLAWASTIHAA